MQTVRYSEDVIFWAERLTEHCYFLYELLNEKALSLKQEAARQYKEWQAMLAKTDYNRLALLLPKLKALKLEIRKLLMNNEFIGTIELSLINHMLEELEHLQKLMNDKVSADDIIEFYLNHASEVAALSAHRLDPSEKSLTMEALEMADHLFSAALDPHDYPDALDLYADSNAMAEDLLKGLEDKSVHASLTPMMVKHEILEAQFGQRKLDLLLQ